jgi:hypothetical protein
MLSQEDFDYTVEQLTGHDPSGILRVMIKDSKADSRILPYIEELLNSSTPCLLYLKPITFAQIRYLAGYALMKQCRVLRVSKTIILPDCILPLTHGDMRVIEEENGLRLKTSGKDSYEESCDLFAQLQCLGKLPKDDIEFQS